MFINARLCPRCRMEPPPLPRNQDCHELWSKRRKRQLKEQQQGGGQAPLLPPHHLHLPTQIQQEPMPPLSYAQHRELVQRQQQQQSYPAGKNTEDTAVTSTYDGDAVPVNSTQGVEHNEDSNGGVTDLPRHPYPGDASNNGGIGSSRSNSPHLVTGPPPTSPVRGGGGGLHQAVGHLAGMISNRQTVNYGHLTSIAKEQVSWQHSNTATSSTKLWICYVTVSCPVGAWECQCNWVGWSLSSHRDANFFYLTKLNVNFNDIMSLEIIYLTRELKEWLTIMKKVTNLSNTLVCNLPVFGGQLMNASPAFSQVCNDFFLQSCTSCSAMRRMQL